MGDTRFQRMDAADGIWFSVVRGTVQFSSKSALAPRFSKEMTVAEFANHLLHNGSERLEAVLEKGGTQIVRVDGHEWRLSVGPELADGIRTGELHRIPSQTELDEEARVYSRRFQLLSDLLPNGVMLIDADGQPTFANKGLHSMMGLPEGKADSSLAMSLVHPDDQERLGRSFQEYLESNKDEWTERYRLLPHTGEILEVESRCLRERDINGDTTGFVSTLFDVSHGMEPGRPNLSLEDELHDSLALGRVGHWSWSEETGRMTWSDSMYEIYRVERGPELHYDFALKHIPDIQVELLQAEIDRANAEGRNWEFEHDIVLADGETRRILSRGRAFLTPSGRRYAGTVIDVTEQREREQKERQAERLRAIGQLASGVAHDFNNMLGAIIGNATVLSEEVSPELQRPVTEIHLAAERVTRLTRQLLTFSRSQQIEKAPVNVHELLDEVYTLVGHSFSPRIRVKRRLYATESIVEADGSQLQSAFLNLLVNARDALQKKGGELEITTRNVELDGQPTIEIVFSDDGPGMSAETRRRAFEPFYTTRREEGGTGLGLSATYGAVLRNGGTLELETEVDEGTAFTIRLYLHQEDSDAESDQHERDQTFDGDGERVWVVDDEPLMRSLASRVFSRAQYDVISFDSGEGVLTALEEDSPDILVVDHHMPGISGTELIERVRGDGFDRRIIVVTGNTFELSTEWAEKFGVKAIVEKPYAVSDLLSAVSDV